MAFYPPNSPGGGGMVIGDPVVGGSPGWILYIDQSGNLTGDANFTRDSSTNVTFAGRQVSPTLVQGLEITNTIAGVLDGAVLTTADFAQNTAGFVGIFDSTPFGGDTVNAGIIAVDGIGNFQTLILSPNPSGGGNLRGSITDNLTEGRLNLAQDLAEIAWKDGTNQARIFANSNYAILQWNVPGPDFGWGIDATGVALFNGTTPVYRMPMSVSGASAGDVMTYDGLGNVTFQPVSATATLTDKYIGVGDASNVLTGYPNFQYDVSTYNFIQGIPNNVNNGVALGSPLQFGAATFSGSGLDDLTLNWSVSNYTSKKYGGNLTIQIDGTGTPDTFSWFYTGTYSEIIGSGTLIPITGGAQTLIDNRGEVVGEISFGATTGHTIGDIWSAGTSLGTFAWGMDLSDPSSHTFLDVKPVYGAYVFGDDYQPGGLAGNGGRLEISDQVGEMGLYSKRYFRIETPGGDTQVLADMANNTWAQYGEFRMTELATGYIWFQSNPNTQITKTGDVSGISNGTLHTVDVTNSSITGVSDIIEFGRNGTGNNTYSQMSDSSQTSFLRADTSISNRTLTWQAGDLGNTVNLTKATLSDSAEKFTFSTGGTDRFIAYKDWTFIGGAVVHGSIQSYTSTGSVSINDNVSTLQYNPASVNATATITLPATSGGSGSIVTIVFGGTITSGNPVVTTLTWAAGSGNTLVASNLPATANAGDSVSFQKIGAFWYQINK